MNRAFLTWSLMLAVVAYSVLVARNILVGVFLATLVYGVSWALRPGTNLYETVRRSPRLMVAGVAAVAVLAYSLIIVRNLLLGVVTAASIVLVAWVTDPWTSVGGGE